MVSSAISTKRPSIISKSNSPELLLREYAFGGDKNLEKIQTLFSNKINIDAAGSDTKKTALHRAVQSGAVKICEFLLEKKASVKVFDKDNKTPLDIAIETKNFKIASMLYVRDIDKEYSGLMSALYNVDLKV